MHTDPNERELPPFPNPMGPRVSLPQPPAHHQQAPAPAVPTFHQQLQAPPQPMAQQPLTEEQQQLVNQFTAASEVAQRQSVLKPVSPVSMKLVLLHQAMNAGLLEVASAVGDSYERFAQEFTLQTGQPMTTQDVRTLVERLLDLAE